MIIRFYTLNDPITNEIRYVGRTRNTLKHRLTQHCAEYKSNSNTYKKNWIKSLKKVGLKPTIFLIKEIDCSWEESYIEEKQIIIDYFSKGHLLTNLNDKGSGSFGITITRPERYVPVLQYDLEGNFIKEWKSVSIAAKELKISNKGISKCLHKKATKAFGFMWKNKTENFLHKIKAVDEILDYGKRKNIIQYNLKGEFIKIFSSATKAAKEINSSQSTLSSSIIRNGVCNGFQWRLKTDNFPLLIKEYNNNLKKVKCVSNKEILMFESLADAAKKFNVSYVTIRNWCKNNNNKKGYIWKFN